MKRAFSLVSILILVSSLACIAGTAKKPVKGHGNSVLQITNATDSTGTIILPDLTVGMPYTYSFTAKGGTPCALTPYHFTITSGSLPPGIQLASNGSLTGILTQEGDYTFEVTVTDCAP